MVTYVGQLSKVGLDRQMESGYAYQARAFRADPVGD
jgi:hypothetical protein